VHGAIGMVFLRGYYSLLLLKNIPSLSLKVILSLDRLIPRYRIRLITLIQKIILKSLENFLDFFIFFYNIKKIIILIKNTKMKKILT